MTTTALSFSPLFYNFEFIFISIILSVDVVITSLSF